MWRIGGGGDAMKYALKASFPIVLFALLLAALHVHLREHQVPHPQVERVSLAKAVIPVLHLLVGSPTVVVPTAEPLIAIGLIESPTALVVPETEQFSCHLRGPPCLL